MRLALVPSTPALLPERASLTDPIAELRRAVSGAIAWLGAEEPVGTVIASGRTGHRVAEHLLAERAEAGGSGVLVVANGTATRTEKAPGFLDQRAAAFDAAIGAALRGADHAALAAIDTGLAEELWAMPDAGALVRLGERAFTVLRSQIDYDDAPYGVQYWVARWECAS